MALDMRLSRIKVLRVLYWSAVLAKVKKLVKVINITKYIM